MTPSTTIPVVQPAIRRLLVRAAALCLCLLLMAGCRPHAGSGAQTAWATADTGRLVRFAGGFTMTRHDGFTELAVRDPWDTTRIMARYLLYRDSLALPRRLQGAIPVRIPVSRVACISGTDAGVLQQLGMSSSIVALGDASFVGDPELAGGLQTGRITSLGQSARIDLEALLTCHPDIFIVNPYEAGQPAAAQMAGIPLVQCTNYMERTPLGRAEWIRFFAAFYGLDAMADSIFSNLSDRYLSLSHAVRGLTERPTVFSELKYGQTWSVPGGRSYMGCFFHDAGVDYIWRDDTSAGSLMLSFETVLQQAAAADFWIIKYNRGGEELTYSRLAAEYPPYRQFKAFRNQHVIVCNTAIIPYFEQGVMQPDVVLADLVHLMRPGMLPDHVPVYFEMMKE